MVLNHYKLTEQLFGVTPDPPLLYVWSRCQEEVRAVTVSSQHPLRRIYVNNVRRRDDKILAQVHFLNPEFMQSAHHGLEQRALLLSNNFVSTLSRPAAGRLIPPVPSQMETAV